MSPNNNEFLARLMLLNLNPIKLSSDYCSFIVRLDRSGRSCSAIVDLSDILSVQNKTTDLNLNVYNLVRKKTEPKLE